MMTHPQCWPRHSTSKIRPWFLLVKVIKSCSMLRYNCIGLAYIVFMHFIFNPVHRNIIVTKHRHIHTTLHTKIYKQKDRQAKRQNERITKEQHCADVQ